MVGQLLFFILIFISTGIANQTGGNSIWTALLSVFGGFNPDAKRLSFTWLFPQLYLTFLGGNYVSNVLSPSLIYHMTRIGSRTYWWISKVITIGFYTVVYYLTAFTTVVGASLLHQIVFVNSDVRLSGIIYLDFQSIDSGYFLLHLFFIFVTTSIAIILVQFLISLSIGSIPAYMITTMMYTAAFFIPSRFVLTTHSNLMAYDEFSNKELTLAFGYAYNIGVTLAFISIGLLIVSKLEFLEKTSGK